MSTRKKTNNLKTIFLLTGFVYTIVTVMAIGINAVYPKERIQRFTHGVVPTEQIAEQHTHMPERYADTHTADSQIISGYESTIFSTETTGQRPPLETSGQVASPLQLESYAHTMVQEHKAITHIASPETKTVVVTSQHDAKLFGLIPVTYQYTTEVAFDGNNGVDANVNIPLLARLATDTLEPPSVETYVENNTIVPQYTEITPRAKAYIIESVVAAIS